MRWVGRDGGQQAHVAISVGVVPLVVLHIERTQQPIAGEDGSDHAGPAHVRALGDEEFRITVFVLVVPDHRLAREDVGIPAPAGR